VATPADLGWLVVVRAGLLAILVVAPLRAETLPLARFALVSDVDAGCPDDRAVRAAVARRLSRDPFSAEAPTLLSARIEADGEGLAARVELHDAAGRVLGRWRVATPRRDCVELASALVLAISIVLDPPRVPPPPPLIATPPTSVSGSLGTQAALGAAPTTAVGVRAGCEASRGGPSLGVELRLDLPRSEDVAGGSVRTWALLGGLTTCAHWSFFYACGLFEAGAIHAAGEGLSESHAATDPAIYAGPRLRAELPLSQSLSLVGQADGLVSLFQNTLRVPPGYAWTTPVFSAVFGLSAKARFR
jgi:hypothetical protein